jgi:hypothetical protein
LWEQQRWSVGHPRHLADEGEGLRINERAAQVEREVMLERQREGIAKAKGQGRYKARKPTARAKADDIRRLAGEGMTREAIAAQLKIGVASVYRVLRAAARDRPGAIGVLRARADQSPAVRRAGATRAWATWRERSGRAGRASN